MIRAVWAASAVLVVTVSASLVAQTPAGVRNFNADAPGAPPPGFTFAATRQPGPGIWTIRSATDGQYLVHEADDPVQPGSSVAIASTPLRDVIVAARLKLPAGGAGGLVWRYQDPQNYYAVSLDFARHEIAMYRVVHGNRVRLDREDDLELDGQAWHTLKVVHEDGAARVYLSGIRVFEVRDRTFRAGPAGVWASSGTRAAFDDLRIEPVKDRSR